MATYYYPIKEELAEEVLKRGLALMPQPHPPMIHVMRTIESARALGEVFYGSTFALLEIEGDFPVYDKNPSLEGKDSVFLTARIPAAAISRVARLKHLEEIRRGVAPEEGVVSQRTYEDMFGRQFQLRRHLHASQRQFSSVGPIHDGEYGYPPRFAPIDARSWAKAEEALDAAVGANIADLRDLPVIKVLDEQRTRAEEVSVWDYPQRGLFGVSVEVWAVDQATIDRGTWDSWIEEPGWYWQRMDVVEVHGPFEDAGQAVDDSRVNFEEPGIAPKRQEGYFIGIPHD